MELTPERLLSASSGAPALDRGLALLQALADGQPSSLEALTNSLKLPRTSTLRLLESLCQLGLIERKQDKSFRALWRVAPLVDPKRAFTIAVQKALNGIVREHEVTAEWYEVTKKGPTIVFQSRPHAEVVVVAKEGYLREWGKELDAVLSIAYAFDESSPVPSKGLSQYVDNGISGKTTLADARLKIAQARKDTFACDPYYNTNGVRRFAVPVCQQGRLLGILSMAQAFKFGPDKAKDLSEAIKTYVPSIVSAVA